jgi:hypothetical protein
MKNLLPRLGLLALALGATPLFAQGDAAKASAPAPKLTPGQRNRASPHETISIYAGGDRRTGSLLTITYGRPYSARGGKGEPRKIWGELVKWDKADRLGADEATTLITPNALEIGGATIPAGAYTLYIIPSENGTSKLAFSKAIGKWGIPVDESADVARVDLKKENLPQRVDQLTLTLDSTPAGGVLGINWENTRFSVPFSVKKG